MSESLNPRLGRLEVEGSAAYESAFGLLAGADSVIVR